ncbi:N-acetyltransferase [Acetobacteraceae bacterium]|nr:N-acetyltransferase [Acetobacteraceae bacterium]
MSVSKTIRPAQEKDLPEILAIYNDAICTTNAVYTETQTTLEERKAWFLRQQEAGFPIFVAITGRNDQEKIAGFGTFGQFRPWAGFKYSVEHSLYINRAFQGQGFGGLILNRLLEEAVKMKLHLMVAGIDSGNKASIRLHEKFGFTSVGLLKEAGYKNGQWLDLNFMQKMLTVR